MWLYSCFSFPYYLFWGLLWMTYQKHPKTNNRTWSIFKAVDHPWVNPLNAPTVGDSHHPSWQPAMSTPAWNIIMSWTCGIFQLCREENPTFSWCFHGKMIGEENIGERILFCIPQNSFYGVMSLMHWASPASPKRPEAPGPGVTNSHIGSQSLAGWWFSHPSEKYESPLGWLETQY